MAAKETGKQRAIRVPLQYYTTPDWVQRYKVKLAVVALVLTAAWWSTGLVRSEGRFRYSRGPVATVHAMWETQCETCHEPFTPIGDRDWFADISGWTWDSDAKCKVCHAGPEHSSRESKDDMPSCAACHRDHRGREASLLRLHDSYCVACHDDLKAHLAAGAEASKPPFENVVTGFVGDEHPEFRLIAEKEKDPGNLKFHHELHMTPGLAQGWNLSEILEEYKERYREVDGVVQLDCSDCHRLDAGDFGIKGKVYQNLAEVHDTRGSGGDMLPITYQNQCRACHASDFEPNVLEELPHGLQPLEVKKFLLGYYTMALDTGANTDIRDQIQDKTRDALNEMFSSRRCGGCHLYGGSDDGEMPERILPTQVPDVWFRHAMFDHNAHRAVSCDECHPGARPTAKQIESTLGGKRELNGKANTPELLDEVLLTGCDRASCQRCHAPAGFDGANPIGGARHDCTECHRYHNGAAPREGLGASEREGTHVFDDVEAFMGGRLEEAKRKPSAKKD